jgi:ankyrin repeat protein
LHIYGWTLGFDLTPADVARKFGHPEAVELILSRLPPTMRLIDALWCGDAERARMERARQPLSFADLHPEDKSLLCGAAWWYRPESVRLMLDSGFDPHVTGAHRSTPLDRASFHGYADIVGMLLAQDPNPPLTFENEFGAIPLRSCIYGSMHGWETGHPRDHARTIQLLLEAGSPLDPTILPTGNDALDSVVRAWLKGRGHHGN